MKIDYRGDSLVSPITIREVKSMNDTMKTILNNTHDGIMLVNQKGIVTLFNKAAERLTGISAINALGMYILDILPNSHLVNTIMTGNTDLNIQSHIGDLDVIVNRIPICNDRGEICGAIGIFHDISDMKDLLSQISELKQIQSMLEAILYSTQDAISVVDEKGINVMVNPAYSKVTGLTEKDVIGKPAEVDIAEGESIHRKVLATGKPVFNARLKAGPKKVDVVAGAAPILVDGKLKGSVSILHDVTEIIQLNKELKDAKRIIRKLEAKYTFDDIAGNNELILTAIEKAKKAADTPATVMLRGESGTGKEMFAHSIHNASSRKYNQFVRVNCAALSDTLLESELFGYEEGAFTGAKKGGKKGLFEEASGGTIFLDEIGEITPSTQVKLLRVIQEREVVRVGGTKPIPINLRIITSTNIDLEKAVKEGKFREDLYYRLNVIPIEVPPLRYRKDDIYILVLNIIKKLNQEYGRNVSDISPLAVETLKGHDWPGNVRELENVIGRAVINMKHNENVILNRHLPQISLFTHKEGIFTNIENVELEEDDIKLEDALAKTEKKFIINALKKNAFNKTKAANALGISIRALYYKMEKHNIKI